MGKIINESLLEVIDKDINSSIVAEKYEDCNTNINEAILIVEEPFIRGYVLLESIGILYTQDSPENTYVNYQILTKDYGDTMWRPGEFLNDFTPLDEEFDRFLVYAHKYKELWMNKSYYLQGNPSLFEYFFKSNLISSIERLDGLDPLCD